MRRRWLWQLALPALQDCLLRHYRHWQAEGRPAPSLLHHHDHAHRHHDDGGGDDGDPLWSVKKRENGDLRLLLPPWLRLLLTPRFLLRGTSCDCEGASERRGTGPSWPGRWHVRARPQRRPLQLLRPPSPFPPPPPLPCFPSKSSAFPHSLAPKPWPSRQPSIPDPTIAQHGLQHRRQGWPVAEKL